MKRKFGLNEKPKPNYTKHVIFSKKIIFIKGKSTTTLALSKVVVDFKLFKMSPVYEGDTRNCLNSCI